MWTIIENLATSNSMISRSYTTFKAFFDGTNLLAEFSNNQKAKI